MKINFLTRFSVFLLVFTTLFSSVGQAKSDSLSQSRALIQVMDQNESLLQLDCNVPETKRCASREGSVLCKIVWDIVQGGIFFIWPGPSYLKRAALQFSRDFLNLNVLSAKHHPPTAV